MRVFYKLDAGGWIETPVNKLAPRDTVKIEDSGVPLAFPADAAFSPGESPGVFIVASVSNVLTVPIRTATSVREHVISFSGA